MSRLRGKLWFQDYANLQSERAETISTSSANISVRWGHEGHLNTSGREGADDRALWNISASNIIYPRSRWGNFPFKYIVQDVYCKFAVWAGLTKSSTFEKSRNRKCVFSSLSKGLVNFSSVRRLVRHERFFVKPCWAFERASVSFLWQISEDIWLTFAHYGSQVLH